MIDLAIVGAGAAGIAAAIEARSRGLVTVILEASDRIGGRAHTFRWQNHALDLGAGWLHSADRNPMVAIAEQMDVAIDRSPSPWRGQYRNLGFTPEEQAQSAKALEVFEERLRTRPPASDRSGDVLDAHCEWNGFLNALSGYLNGASLDRVSAADWVAYWEEAGEENWRLPIGYGSLITKLADGLDVRTGCQVREVDWSSKHTRLRTDRGTIEARHAVVAVPTRVLARGDIAFVPSLDDKLHSAAQLPLGHVEKLFFTLAEPEAFPKDAHLIGKPRSAETGSYMLRPMGMPAIEGFFGGDWVSGLTAAELAQLAREELGALLGDQLGKSLHTIAESDWQRDPYIGGSYSYARPGQHGSRASLAAAIDAPIAFTGEACSNTDFATVHGAWRCGKAAVAQLFGENS